MTGALSVGLLGVGNIGTVHLQSMRTMDDVTVTAAADVDAANRRRAEAAGVEATYEEFETLLASESVDAVVVALPPFLHAEAVTSAVEAGCHAFVEKPLARTESEARDLVDAADRAGVRLGVDHTIRYMPEIRQLKERYDEGSLGHVPMGAITRINDGPFATPPGAEPLSAWQLDPEATGGGALMDLGVHLFDVLEWFFGDIEVQHATLDRQLEIPYEDTASVVVESGETGTVATLNCGFFQWERPPDVNMRFRLEGVAGTADSTEFAPANFLTHAAESALTNVAKRLRGSEPDYFEPTYFYQGHYLALRDFLEAIDEGRAPPVSGEEGARAVGLVEDAYDLAEFDPRELDREGADEGEETDREAEEETDGDAEEETDEEVVA